MDLSFWLTTLSLGILFYAAGRWWWTNRRPAESVKNKPPRRAFKLRSRRSNVQNVVNAGSGQQEAEKPPVNVQPNAPLEQPPAPAIVPPAAPAGGLVITPIELTQLAEAVRVRAEGATVEEAILAGFGAKKGASAAYVRAKELFDAATGLPPATGGAGAYPKAPPARQRARRRSPAAR